jgi:hypothetical protein
MPTNRIIKLRVSNNTSDIELYRNTLIEYLADLIDDDNLDFDNMTDEELIEALNGEHGAEARTAVRDDYVDVLGMDAQFELLNETTEDN